MQMDDDHTEEGQATHKCNNCGKPIAIYKALLIYNNQQLTAVLCPACQQAKKIQITLEKVNNKWTFYQYFPVES